MSELEKRGKRSREACQVLQNPTAAYDEITHLQSEVERLRGRCGDIEDFCADKIGRLPLPHDRTDFANGRYTAFHEVYVEVQRLRQQADEIEKTGG